MTLTNRGHMVKSGPVGAITLTNVAFVTSGCFTSGRRRSRQHHVESRWHAQRNAHVALPGRLRAERRRNVRPVDVRQPRVVRPSTVSARPIHPLQCHGPFGNCRRDPLADLAVTIARHTRSGCVGGIHRQRHHHEQRTESGDQRCALRRSHGADRIGDAESGFVHVRCVDRMLAGNPSERWQPDRHIAVSRERGTLTNTVSVAAQQTIRSGQTIWRPRRRRERRIDLHRPTTANAGPGTLRQAILDANTHANVGAARHDCVRHSRHRAVHHRADVVASGDYRSGLHRCYFAAGLHRRPYIELDGGAAGGTADGSSSPGATRRAGVVINRFGTGEVPTIPGDGIVIQGAGGNVVVRNRSAPTPPAVGPRESCGRRLHRQQPEQPHRPYRPGVPERALRQ